MSTCTNISCILNNTKILSYEFTRTQKVQGSFRKYEKNTVIAVKSTSHVSTIPGSWCPSSKKLKKPRCLIKQVSSAIRYGTYVKSFLELCNEHQPTNQLHQLYYPITVDVGCGPSSVLIWPRESPSQSILSLVLHTILLSYHTRVTQRTRQGSPLGRRVVYVTTYPPTLGPTYIVYAPSNSASLSSVCPLTSHMSENYNPRCTLW